MSDLSGQYLGRYYLSERLGEGGMAVVYKAYDTRLERDVAIKIIRSGAFPTDALNEVLKRFEREAKSLAKLSHPNIVKVHDYGEHEGSPYLVMEYLPGGTLKKILDKPVPWQEAVRLILPVARGVAYAHQRGVLHRDIKPANILITESGEPMLSDFGIAKLFEGNQATALTGSGMAIGTPEYMAPEQWTGITSPLSDLYSLGIVLYEMVTGRKPYGADTPAAILIKQATEPLPNPRKFAVDLPEVLELVLIKALAREPKDRYQDINSFISALGNLFVGAPVTSSPSEEKHIEEAYESPEQKTVSPLLTKTLKQVGSESINTVYDAESQKVEEALSLVASVAKTRVPIKFSSKGMGLMISGIVIVFAVWLALPMLETRFSPAPVITESATLAPSPSPSETMEPTSTGEATASAIPSTKGMTPTTTALPAEITDAKGVSVRLVAAGEFSMGYFANGAYEFCETFSTYLIWYGYPCDRKDYLREEPVHKVFLNAFYMDVFEVSNSEYRKCVTEGACLPPSSNSANRFSRYYDNENLGDYPVLNVTWDMAKAYCEWRGARLPTEAEWEKAARGIDERSHPWGNFNSAYEVYNPAFYVDRANLNLTPGFITATVPVTSNPLGISPYGLYNMAGNVAEWVADWYNETYYGVSPYENPPGPLSGDYKVIRGGSVNTYEIRTTARDYRKSSEYDSATGIRCAKDANP